MTSSSHLVAWCQWGLVQWSSRLLRLLLHSGAVTSQSLLKDIMGAHPFSPHAHPPSTAPVAGAPACGGGNYHRLDPVMRDDPIAFDQVHRVGELVAMAEEVDIKETVDFIKHSYMHTAGQGRE